MTWLPLLVGLAASDAKPVVSVLYFDNRSGGTGLEVAHVLAGRRRWIGTGL